MSEGNSNISDQELVSYCIRHERRYQEILYRTYADEMYSVALIYSDDDQDACDIVQESFIKVFKKIETFKFECTLKSWIRKIIVNTALDHFRRKKREMENVQNYVQSVEIEVDEILPSINATELLGMLQLLPKKAAMVLKLFAIEGYGHKEIADMLQITEGTSKSQLNRARLLLKSIITEYNGVA
jgi:RNA polymerase sigma-70 factor (ECF subfamily)